MIARSLAVVLAAIAVLYLAICALLYVQQRSYLYYPTARQGDAPVIVLRGDGADVVVSTNGVESPRAVLYFGGNAEDVSQSIPLLGKAFPDRAIYAMHYRGYGGSTGTPSEAKLVADARRLSGLVAKDHPHVVVVGRSLGSGIAIQVAAAARIERLVLVTPYDSIVEIAASRFALFPVRLLLRDKYESWRYAPLVHVPTTIIVANDDRVIPNESSLRLAERFRAGVAHIVRFEHAGHDDVSAFDGYAEALAGHHGDGDRSAHSP